MRLACLLSLGVLVSSLAGCTEEIVSPAESFPEKLVPYETLFDLTTFEQRRDDLISRLPANSIAVVSTNDTHLRNGDVEYEFRPSSTFLYLTGFDEPLSSAVIRRSASNPGHAEMILFVQERSPAEIKWLGPSYGTEDATRIFGASEAYSIAEFEGKLRVYLAAGPLDGIYGNLAVNETAESIVDNVVGGSIAIHDIDVIVDKMRVVKSAIEVTSIRRAVDISVQAFQEAMKRIEPGMYEYEVDALFDYVLRLNGSARAAFPTIVASGPNVNVLHYEANVRRMESGDLVMIDFGAEYGYYASDVTRTLPVNGTFTYEQAVVYDIVLDAHRAVVAAAAPGVDYYDLYHEARDIVLDGLLDAGIITGSKQDIISSGRYRQYFVAGLGHCVGLDVHDPFPNDAPGSRILKEGVVIAFEPHIYLDGSDTSVSKAYRGIAARIEDTVLITSTGAEILSGALPWETADIEAAMK